MWSLIGSWQTRVSGPGRPSPSGSVTGPSDSVYSCCRKECPTYVRAPINTNCAKQFRNFETIQKNPPPPPISFSSPIHVLAPRSMFDIVSSLKFLKEIEVDAIHAACAGEDHIELDSLVCSCYNASQAFIHVMQATTHPLEPLSGIFDTLGALSRTFRARLRPLPNMEVTPGLATTPRRLSSSCR